MRILVLPGDGIGPEITAATMAVMNAVNDRHGLGLEFEYDIVGFESLEKHGSTFRPELQEKFPTYDGVILGPNQAADYPPREEGGINFSAFTRTQYDLYANIRPARTYPGVAAPVGPFDMVIVREVTEGHYSDRNMHLGHAEVMPDPDMVISMRKVTRRACERIARRAFELAMGRRKHLTPVHKANVLKMGDGLFLQAVEEVGRDFPEVTVEPILIDAMCAHLVRRPADFDVIVTGNMYGDIISDLAGELSGSLGLSGAIMAGDDLCAAQAQHGSAPDIAGQDKANPVSLILSAAMLLDWMGARHGRADLGAAAEPIRAATDTALARPETRTADLGGSLGTSAFGQAVTDALG
ncbi:MAG: isocitrate/isopropylmalate dehydrogenase family protein [Pseudomonadota bacterium]